MHYLALNEVLELYQRVMEQSAGTIEGILDLNAIEAAVAQHRMTFGGQKLYPTIAEEASVPGFSLHLL